MVASVYQEEGLVDKARAIYTGKIEPWAQAGGKLAQEVGARYQKLAQAFGTAPVR